MYVKDGARNLTSTTTNADSTTGSPFSPFNGPLSFFYNAIYKNFYLSTSSAVKLTNPFNLSNPSLVPLSSSNICFNASAPHTTAHPFNPLMPINYDTTGGAVNYNVPLAPPEYTTSKASDAFFTVGNYIGAFPFTGSSTDNWMKGWCQFDPNNAFYDTTCYVPTTGVTPDLNNVIASGINVFPNPTNGNATVTVDVRQACTVKVAVLDMTGRMVKEVANVYATSGTQSFDFNTDALASGVYIMSVTMNNRTRAVRFNVVK
jgi:hypothetical protein